MAKPTGDYEFVRCRCEAKVKVPSPAEGKKLRCPECGAVFRVRGRGTKTEDVAGPPAPSRRDAGAIRSEPRSRGSAPPPSPSRPVAPPPVPRRAEPPLAPIFAEADDDPGYEIAEDGSSLFSVVDESESAGTTACPGCGASMPGDAVICTACGYDTRTGRVTEPTPSTFAEQPAQSQSRRRTRQPMQGSFALGIALSAAGAILGAVVWFVVAKATDREFGVIAWGIGIVTGLGMVFGYRTQDVRAGLVSAAMTFLSIMAAKWLIYVQVLRPQLAELDPAFDGGDFRRQAVASKLLEGAFQQRGGDNDNMSDDEYDAIDADVQKRVAAMTEAEVEQQWNQLDAETREAFQSGQKIGRFVFGAVVIFTLFGLWDIIFLILAVVTGYKVGNGSGTYGSLRMWRD